VAIDPNMLKNRAQSAMAGFSPGQRVVVGIAIATLVAGGFFFAQWASKPTMVPLYSNLSGDDASEITAKLASAGVPYELANGGNTIMVPQAQVYQTRIDMAGEGLPTGGSAGYALLDKSGITTSDFKQHVDYKRAIEGELAKTIGSIQGVEAATVHLVIPENDVFADDDKKPTASVLVKLAAGKTLGNTQVQSIVNLVAGGVEGLNAENVTVTDDKGRMLAAPGQGVNGGDEQQRAQTASLETDLNTKIQNMLVPLVGAGKVSVATRAELNWDKTTEKSEIFNPNNKPVQATSQESTTETYSNGANPGAVGCLGVGQETTEECDTGATGANGSGDYNKTSSSQDNATDRVITETQKTPGSINRLTVAVVYDSNVANIDQAQVEDIVTKAAGIQAARGDEVSVTPMPFDNSAQDANAKELEEAAKADKSAQTMGLIKTGATVLIILVVLVILVLTTRKRAAAWSGAQPISQSEIDAFMPSTLPAAESLASLNAAEIVDNSPEALERQKVDSEITDLIEKQPDEVAALLRSWLADRRS
jgi:flagellar M-ring protein FliF